MLDFRVHTFIELCRTKNYTKAAEKLHMTQPAVTQHIKYLEEFYNCKLFNYDKRVLKTTEQGEKLYKYLLTMISDERKVKEDILGVNSNKKVLRLGATLTIGEYIIPKILDSLSESMRELDIKVMVKDTSELLEELKKGSIEFALVEGFFEKTDYDSYIFAKEKFVGICSKDSELADKKCTFEDLLDRRLILREEGSGSRGIFEKILYDNNLSIKNFKSRYEIENINVIKEMVKKDAGISFIYKKAVKKEIEEDKIAIIDMDGKIEEREFNFVFLKNSYHKDEYRDWYTIMKDIFEKNIK